MSSVTEWSEDRVEDLLRLRKEGKTWPSIAKWMNKTHATDFSEDCYRSKYRRIRDKFPVQGEADEIEYLRNSARLKRVNSRINSKQNLLLKHWDETEDLLSSISKAVIECSRNKVKIEPFKKPKTKEKYTVELLLSDIHMGKHNEYCNQDIIEERMSTVCREFLDFVKSSGKVERIIIGTLGDLIESETMHGVQSARNSQFANPQQIQAIIAALWERVLLPIGKLGIPIDFVGVAGNHDRSESKREYNFPGKNNYTYVIYHTLQMLCKTAGLKHIKFIIPDRAYMILKVYGRNVLYEHGDTVKACTAKAFETQLQNRQKQLHIIISYMRVGHYHNYNCFDNGRMITNGGLPGDEGYADTMGYKSEPGQVFTVYSNTWKNVYLYTVFIKV